MGFFTKVDPEIQKLRYKAEIRKLQEKKGEEMAKYEEQKELDKLKSQVQELKHGPKSDKPTFNPEKVEKVKGFLHSMMEGAKSFSSSASTPSPKRKKSPPKDNSYSGFGGGGFDPMGSQQPMQFGDPMAEFSRRPKTRKNYRDPMAGEGMGYYGDPMAEFAPKKGRRKKQYNPNNWY